MKILFSQNIANIAGSEKYLLALIPELMQRGMRCEFLNVYLHENKQVAQEYTRQLEELGVAVHEIAVSSYASIPLLFKINNVYKKGKFDAVNTHLIYAEFWFSVIKLFLNPRLKIFSTKHGYQEKSLVPNCLTPENIPHNLAYYVFRFTDRIIDKSYACSYGLRNFYERAGLTPKGSMEVIQHGFDYPVPPETPVEACRLGTPQLIIVGRLLKRKGHHFVFKILPQITAQYPGVKLLILGSGAYEAELRSQVAEMNLEEHVVFLGYKTNVLEYMNASDVILVPSYSEGLPLVLFEAFNAKRPAIAFDTIGCNEAIDHNHTGMIAPAYETEMFKNHILELLAKPGKANQLASNAYERLTGHFCLRRMVDETIAFYERHLNQLVAGKTPSSTSMS
ncbi:MAG: glycosyltransferase family 4 protein [Bacteroidota bacterium]